MIKSPTARLLLGLLITLIAVACSSWYTLNRIAGLRKLQTDTIDRNRRDTLQLLRMQNALSSLGLALRDMAQGDESYGISAYHNELNRIRGDLDDAVRTEASLSPVTRSPAQKAQMQNSIRQFWQTSDQVFALAAGGKEEEAKRLVGSTLSAQQASLATAVARLLFQNNDAEERAAARVATIYDGVEGGLYGFLVAMLLTIIAASLYLIYSNGRLFQKLESLSQQRRVLAAKLITVQEEVLRSVSRELHDEFGQILTAVGAMLGRAERKGVPPDSPLRTELHEIRQITQDTLEKMRSLSQMLHPAVLDDYGLVKGLDWYTQLFQKQTGVETSLSVRGDTQRITGQAAIHCFRIVQEALNNAAKHAHTKTAEVTMQFDPDRLQLTIRDFGTGVVTEKKSKKPGLGLVAMQERAVLMRGELTVSPAPGGGTMVILLVPLPKDEGQAYLAQGREESRVAGHD